jgi:ABC-type uncharacterized transport system YnjBCD ATPase subunit
MYVLLSISGAALLKKVPLFQAFLIDFPDVFNGENRPVIGIVRMLLAVPLIVIDFSQHLDKLLFGMFDGSEQLIVEMQNLGSPVIGCAAVIHSDVTVQLGFNAIESAGYIFINRFSDDFRQR